MNSAIYKPTSAAESYLIQCARHSHTPNMENAGQPQITLPRDNKQVCFPVALSVSDRPMDQHNLGRPLPVYNFLSAYFAKALSFAFHNT